MNKYTLLFFIVVNSMLYTSCKLFKPFYEHKKNNIIKDSSQVLKYKDIKKAIRTKPTEDTITYIKAKIITISSQNDTITEVVGQKNVQPYSHLYPLLNKNNIQFENVSFKAKVHYDANGNSQNFTSNFRLCKDSITWCSISAIIGEVARAVVDKDSIKAIDKLGNKALIYAYNDLSNLIQIDLPHRMLQELIVGNTLFAAETDKIISFTPDVYGTFKITTSSSLGEFIYGFNADTTINSIQLNTIVREKPYSITIYYSNYEPYEQYRLSTHRTFLIQQDNKTTNVELNILKFNINIPELDYPFAIPKHFKRTHKKAE